MQQKLSTTSADSWEEPLAIEVTASACLQGKYLVKGKSGYIVPLNNYIAVVARPAKRKSSICAIFEEPSKAYEKKKNETHALDIAQSANIRQVLEKELEALKNAAVKVKKGKDNNESAAPQANNYAESESSNICISKFWTATLPPLCIDYSQFIWAFIRNFLESYIIKHFAH